MAVLSLDTPVTELSGIGKVKAQQLDKLGIKTINDLIFHFPRAYERRGDVIPLSRLDTDKCCSFILTVACEVTQATLKRGLTISKFRAFDESGSCEVVFFNSPFIKNVFHIGSEFRFYGKPVL